MYGPSFRPFKIVKNSGSYHSYVPVDSDEPEQQRRTIYRMNVNSGGNPMLDALDCPVPSVKTPQRVHHHDPAPIAQPDEQPLRPAAGEGAGGAFVEGTPIHLRVYERISTCSRPTSQPRNSPRQSHWSTGTVLRHSAGRYSMPVSLSMSTDRNSTRRRLLLDSGAGFGWLALSICGCTAKRALPRDRPAAFRAKVKRVVQVFCVGGMSHLDTFDYKPELSRRNGQPFNMPTFFGQAGNLLGSVFEFKQRGQSGLWVSDLLPEPGAMRRQTDGHSHHGLQEREPYACGRADEHRLHPDRIPEHGRVGRLRAGSENENLPSFVVLPDPRAYPWGGTLQWSNGFLPAAVQGTAFRSAGDPVPDLSNPPERIRRHGGRVSNGSRR